jgi:hypothetical protein
LSGVTFPLNPASVNRSASSRHVIVEHRHWQVRRKNGHGYLACDASISILSILGTANDQRLSLAPPSSALTTGGVLAYPGA